jgi:hypothetical protein
LGGFDAIAISRMEEEGMTSISPSVAAVEVRATPKARARNAALDRARTFLTLVVLFPHAVIPYT